MKAKRAAPSISQPRVTQSKGRQKFLHGQIQSHPEYGSASRGTDLTVQRKKKLMLNSAPPPQSELTNARALFDAWQGTQASYFQQQLLLEER